MEVEPIRDMRDVKRMYQQLLEDATPREAECFLIGCNVALRAGDLLSLRFDQIEGKTHVVINEQKTGKRKQFPVTKTVRDAVARLREYYSAGEFYKSKGDWKPEYLFQSTSNRAYYLCQPICIQWLGLAMKDAARKVGIKENINTHTMRKTWGYHAYENGEDILYIQALLNHSNQHVTLRYIGVTKSTIEKMYHTNTLEIA
jgi:integrase